MKLLNISKLDPHARAYLENRNTSSHFQKRKKKTKSERLESRLRANRRTAAHLRQLGYYEDADAVLQCSQKYRILTCGDHVLQKTDFFRCGKAKLCAFCANKRSTEKIRHYLPPVEAYLKNSSLQLCPLVLTQPKKKGERFSKARKRLLKSFRTFIRLKIFDQFFDGGIWSIEAVFSENVAHVHMHISVFRRRMLSKSELEELKNAWAKCSPGAKNLYLGAPRSASEALVENLKYLTKGILTDDLTVEHVAQILETKNQQMSNTFGGFREFMKTFTPPETDEPTEDEAEEKEAVEKCCAICSKTVYEQTVSANELLELYKRQEARHHQTATFH